MTDPLCGSLPGCDVKRAGRTHCYSTYVGSHLAASRDDRTDEITCLEALDTPGLLGASTRETVLIHPTHLARPMPVGCDEQGGDASRAEMVRGTCPDTGRIDPVCFGQAQPCPVVLGSPARATFDGQS